MRDETLIEPFGAVETYCDGFTDFKITGGNMSCVGYRLQDATNGDGEQLKAVVVRLIFPKECVPTAIAEAQAILTGGPPKAGFGVRRRAH